MLKTIMIDNNNNKKTNLRIEQTAHWHQCANVNSQSI